MCFFGGGGSSYTEPTAAEAVDSPTSESIAAEAATSVTESRAKTATQQGTYGNIYTSNFGDGDYGTYNGDTVRYGVRTKKAA